MKGGTLVERLVAYYGVGLLAALALLMFSTAFDPRFGLGSPLWLGGFLPALALVPTIRQLRAWNGGSRASSLLDPFRTRLGLRALPTVAWLAAGGLTVLAIYVLLNMAGVLQVTDTSAAKVSANPFLYGAFLAALGVDFVMTWRSDRRDRRIKEAAGEELVPDSAPDKKMLMAAQELPAGVRMTATILFWLTLVGGLSTFVLLVIPQVVPTPIFMVALLPGFAWIGYGQLVIRPRLRRIEREQASRAEPP